MPRLSVEERFWLRVRKDPDGCWRWTGTLFQGSRYSLLTVNRQPALGHRVAWELLRGPIPEGAHIDHLCRVRECVNPDHLEPVTCRENLLRGETLAAANAAKTECKNGHPFDSENTYWFAGKRGCRACRREVRRAYERRQRELRVPAVPRTHCIAGHEFTEENTYLTPKGNRRQCRTCLKRRSQEARARRKAG